MSDIKYIIAGDDGEHTRFPCLAMARYAAAAVVTVLAVAVIAMVIHAVLRSEDIRLSVNNGYIGADHLWSQTEVPVAAKTTTEAQIGVGKMSDKLPEATTTTVPSINPVIGENVGLGGDDGEGGSAILPRECYIGCSGGKRSYHNQPVTQATFQRANMVNLRVILIANNPGGRTKIDCNETTVRLIDNQSPYGKIAELKLGNFTVPPQTTITLQKRLKITDPAALSYIWDNYGLENRFSVMVWVNASVTSYPLGAKTETKTQTYVCWPVTVGLIDDETTFATGEVDCRAEPGRMPPAPAPAPAPAP